MIVLTSSCLFYIVTGLQVWLAHYLKTVLDVPPAEADAMFCIICITSPILGAIVSSVISTKIGGHNSPHTLPICAACSIIAAVFAVMFPLVDDTRIANFCCWMVMFFGGIILPMLTGVMLSTLNMEERATANGLANFSYNVLGYFPAPAIYGFLDSF